MDPNRAIELIFEELRKAEEKYPGWPDDLVHGVAILVEEAGEAMKEALDVHYKGKSRVSLIEELAQTGAMAIRMLIKLKEEQNGIIAEIENQGRNSLPQRIDERERELQGL